MTRLLYTNPASAGYSMTFSVLTDVIKETPFSSKYRRNKILVNFYNEHFLYKNNIYPASL
jgi:hypothetical protein